MSHRIACPNCHATFKAAEAPPPGKRGRCPKCKQSFSIEPPRSSTADTARPPQSDEPQVRRSQAAPSAGHGKSAMLLALGVMLCLLGGGGAYWFLTLKKPSGGANAGDANPVSSQSTDEFVSQPAQNPQGAPAQPKNEASSPQNGRANQPVAAEAGAAESELKLPMRLKSEGSAQSLTFAPDGSLLAVASYDGITLYEVATGKVYRTLPFPIRSDRPLAVEFAPNSLAIAAATAGQFTVWQVSDGRALMTIRADESDLDPAQPLFVFSPSGKHVAVT